MPYCTLSLAGLTAYKQLGHCMLSVLTVIGYGIHKSSSTRRAHVLGVGILLAIGLLLCYPDTLHHPDNYCYVDRYTTPQHIVPEWYFLPFYSMLRACSSKGIGVLLLVGSLVVYVLLVLTPTEGHTSSGISCITGDGIGLVHGIPLEIVSAISIMRSCC